MGDLAASEADFFHDGFDRITLPALLASWAVAAFAGAAWALQVRFPYQPMAWFQGMVFPAYLWYATVPLDDALGDDAEA